MKSRRSEKQRVSLFFTWWSQEVGTDDQLAQLLNVSKTTIWRWRTGDIKSVRLSHRREITRLLRIKPETFNEFLDGRITLKCLVSRRGENSVSLEELLVEIECRPPNELMAVKQHVTALLANASGPVSVLEKNLCPDTLNSDTLNREKKEDTTTVIYLETYKQARRLGNLMLAAQERLGGLNHREYLQLVSRGNPQYLEMVSLLYSDVMDETLRSHTELAYELFCPFLFRLVEWQGRDRDQPLISTSTYPDVQTLLNDLRNSNSYMAVR